MARMMTTATRLMSGICQGMKKPLKNGLAEKAEMNRHRPDHAQRIADQPDQPGLCCHHPHDLAVGDADRLQRAELLDVCRG